MITEEDAKMFCVKVLRKRSVEDPRENVPVTDGVVLPAITRRSVGVVEPMPMLPLARIEKYEAPDEEATLNGLRLEVEDGCTLKLKVEEVALIPATVPLSIKVEVAIVFGPVYLTPYPLTPPEIPMFAKDRTPVPSVTSE